MFTAVACVDLKWGIGKDGKLLELIPADMERFVSVTYGNYIVMGRKTFESLPKGGPLPDRINIVITRDKEFKGADIVFHSIGEFISWSKNINHKEIVVIGGGQIYGQLLPYCDKVHITCIFKEYEGVDTWFPNLDKDDDWELTYNTHMLRYKDLAYKFRTYERKGT